MKPALIAIFFILYIQASAQVAITTDNSVADITAMLDIKSNAKGLLIPRLSSAERISIIAPATGLLIYQVDDNAGFYYNAGSTSGPNWLSLANNKSSWSTQGNAGITTNSFIGTTDNNSLRIRLNNLNAGILDPSKQNIALGIGALESTTTGSHNVAIGWAAMKNNVVGSNMVAIGDSALYNQVSATKWFNTAVGAKTLQSNTTGYENTACGFASLTSNTTGTDNTAIGDGSMRNNITGHANSAIGFHALYNNDTGRYNAAMASFSLVNNVTGNGNSALGFAADVTADGFSNATAIGYYAKVDASDKVRIGNGSVTSIGGQVSWTTFSDGRFKLNVTEDIPGMSFIKKLRPVSYIVDQEAIHKIYKTDTEDIFPLLPLSSYSSRQSGFIAQEVEIAAKESGFAFSGVDKPTNAQALYGLRYADFVVPMIKGMQEQQVIIERQQNIIERLEERLKKIEAMLTEITVDKKISK